MAVPSAYGRDPFNELNRQLEAHHTTPGSIKKTCEAVEECLANNRDNLRGFFDKPFSNLLKRIFGYGDYDASWLIIVTKGRDADARALVDLLAPDGKLFAAMAQADSDHLVEYIFPTERLPAHTQELLNEPQGYGRTLLDTWPQYRGRIRPDAAGRSQVYLNLFEYFMFWTAFFVLRGGSSDSGRNDPRTQSGSGSSPMAYGMNSLRMVGNLMMGRSTDPLQGLPYYCLLKTYLEYFLPRSGGGGGSAGGGADGASASRAAAAIIPQSAAAGSVGVGGGVCGLGGYGFGIGIGSRVGGTGAAVGWASYKPSLTAAAAGPDSRGAVLLSILVEFWLTDLTEPLPSAVADRPNVGALHSGGAGGPIGSGLGGPAVSPITATASTAAGIVGTASPVPVSVATAPSVRMLTYQPPSEELVEGLVALVRYVHVIDQDMRLGGLGSGTGLGAGSRSPTASGIGASAAVTGIAGTTMRISAGGTGRHSSGGGSGCVAGGGGSSLMLQVQLQPAQVGRAPWLPETPIKTPPPPAPRLLFPPTALLVHGSSATPAVQAVSRKVYRQLRRAFTQWPPSSPNSLTPLITLWLSVLAPWFPSDAQTRKAAAGGGSGAGDSPVPSAGVSGNSGGGFGGAASTSVGGGGLFSSSGGVVRSQHQTYHDRIGALGTAAAGVVEATVGRLQLGGGSTGAKVVPYKYTPAWRGHVLAHLPFYLLLLPQFASLSLSRLKYRPDVALRDLDRVLSMLAASGPELLRELRTAEEALNDFLRPASASSAAPGAGGAGGGGRVRRRGREGEYGEMASWWVEQAHDFEAAAVAGSSLPGAVQPDVTGRLFSIDTSGMAYTICLVLHNAEALGRSDLVSALRQSASAVLPLESMLPAAAAAEQGRQGDGAEGLLAGIVDPRRFPKAGHWSSHLRSLVRQDPRLARPSRLWEHVYRGPDGRNDPMYRPITSREFAGLARLLLAVSEWLNRALGLDKPYQPGEEEEDPPETVIVKMLLQLRKWGFRFNLRFLAEKQMLMWLMVLSIIGYFTLGPTINVLWVLGDMLCPWFVKKMFVSVLSLFGAVWGVLRIMPVAPQTSRPGASGSGRVGGGGMMTPRAGDSTTVGGGGANHAAEGVRGGVFVGGVRQRFNEPGGQGGVGEVVFGAAGGPGGAGGGGGGYRFRA